MNPEPDIHRVALAVALAETMAQVGAALKSAAPEIVNAMAQVGAALKSAAPEIVNAAIKAGAAQPLPPIGDILVPPLQPPWPADPFSRN